MVADSDEIHLMTARQPDIHRPAKKKDLSSKSLKNAKASKNKENLVRSSQAKPVETKTELSYKTTISTTHNEQSSEERQRTGRYLAVGVTLVMLFIAFYHTLMRHTTVLAGLLAPAIIMLLYILWLLYFAKKRKRQVAIV